MMELHEIVQMNTYKQTYKHVRTKTYTQNQIFMLSSVMAITIKQTCSGWIVGSDRPLRQNTHPLYNAKEPYRQDLKVGPFVLEDPL